MGAMTPRSLSGSSGSGMTGSQFTRNGSTGSSCVSRKRNRLTCVPVTWECRRRPWLSASVKPCGVTWSWSATEPTIAGQSCGRTASRQSGGRHDDPRRRNSPGCGTVLVGSGSVATSGRSGRWPSSGSPRSGWSLPSASTAKGGTMYTPLRRSQTNVRLPISAGSSQRSARSPPLRGWFRKTRATSAPTGTVERQAWMAASPDTWRALPLASVIVLAAVRTCGTLPRAVARSPWRSCQARAVRCTIRGVQLSRTASGSSQTRTTAPLTGSSLASKPQARAWTDACQSAPIPLRARMPPCQWVATPCVALEGVVPSAPGVVDAAALRLRSRCIATASA